MALLLHNSCYGWVRCCAGITRGALGSAAADLVQAASYAATAAASHSDMAAAWKVLGDVLLLHHAVTPAPQLDQVITSQQLHRDDGGSGGGPPAADEGGVGGGQVAALLEDWRRRISAVAAAGVAYRRALTSDPGGSGNGGRHADLAAALYQVEGAAAGCC